MRTPDSDFAPDLDWMLLSGQVGEDLLLEALLQEFYVETYRLALAIFDDKQLALSTTIKIFASAILQRHQYREGDNVKLWFINQALLIIKEIDFSTVRKTDGEPRLAKYGSNLDLENLSPDQYLDIELWSVLDNFDYDRRALAILIYLLKWSDDHLVSVFNCTAEELNHQKRYLNSVLLPYRMDQAARSKISLEERLYQSLNQRWPQHIIPPLEPAQTIRQVRNQIRINRVRNRLSASYREIMITALIILIATISIWGLNRYDPDQPASWLQSTQEAENRILREENSSDLDINSSNDLTDGANEGTPTNITEVFYTVRPGDTLNRIAQDFSVNPDFLREINRIPVEKDVESGQRIWFFTNQDNPQMELAGYRETLGDVNYAEKFPYLGLSIIRGLEFSRPDLETVWLGGKVSDYGPEAYIGPPRIKIIQAWFLKNAALYLIGNELNKLEEVWLFKDFYQFMATPAVEVAWVHPWYPANPESPYLGSIQLFSDTLAGRTESTKHHKYTERVEEIVDENVVILWQTYNDYANLVEKIWVPENSGYIVKRQLFSGEMVSLLKQEILINDFVENKPFPTDFFDPRIPWRGGFAADYQGQPAPEMNTFADIIPGEGRARLSPVQNIPDTNPIDFATASLTFQYPENYTHTHSALVEIFADSKFIGTGSLGDPWSMICSRSPDGNLLAYVSQPSSTPLEATQLHLLDLRKPEQDQKPIAAEFLAENFSFSPDGKYLAVFGRRDSLSAGELLIVDLVHSLTYRLDQLGSANSLVWSPDGNQLALIARIQSNEYLEEILVYDLNSGQIVYRSSIDFEDNRSQDWPMAEWGVDFPVEMGDLTICAASPIMEP